jgi:hypothetical protein
MKLYPSMMIVNFNHFCLYMLDNKNPWMFRLSHFGCAHMPILFTFDILLHLFIFKYISFHSLFCNYVDISYSSFMIAKRSHEDDGSHIIEKLDEAYQVRAFYILIENYKCPCFSLICYWTCFTGSVRKVRTWTAQVANKFWI